MRILLTNDDGIYAPGIEALACALRSIGEVTVVAPDVEQSAVGHSITLAVPLRVREVRKRGELFGYGVKGAPADCVKLALAALCEERPDVVVSGINFGANVGIDVFYSGTVAAALEAAFVGIPAVAASIALSPEPDLEFAAKVVREQVQALPLGEAEAPLLNINVPAVPADQVKGVRLTRQCMKPYTDRYVRRSDPRGRDYFWLDGDLACDETDTDTDVVAIRDGYVSVTPLKHDLTDPHALAAMKGKEQTP